jgi:hypothetical protein
MRYDFIEIGTSDFDTLIEITKNEIGLSIEPVKHYLDKLPNNPTVIKANIGVSNVRTISKVFWVEEEDIVRYNLPWYIKGCNSVHNPHPVTINELKKRGLEHLMKEKNVEILDWDGLVERYNINIVRLVKIDCEGHDTVIVNNIIDSKSQVLPYQINFEANELTPDEVRESTIMRAQQKGYRLIEYNPSIAQVILRLEE